jgi:hypothetical protein
MGIFFNQIPQILVFLRVRLNHLLLFIQFHPYHSSCDSEVRKFELTKDLRPPDLDDSLTGTTAPRANLQLLLSLVGSLSPHA